MTNKQLDLCICEIATGNREALRQLYDEFKNPIFLFDLSIVFLLSVFDPLHKPPHLCPRKIRCIDPGIGRLLHCRPFPHRIIIQEEMPVFLPSGTPA